MQESYMEEVQDYVLRKHNMVSQYTAMRPILDLCEEAVRRPGTRVFFERWWEQEGLDLEGEKSVKEAAAKG